MPQNTPERGYPYPLYQDPMDFPAQIQALATDMDTDIADLNQFIDGAYNRPSARIYGSAAQAIATSTTTTVSWAGAGIDYDNDGMPTLTSTGGLTLTDRGIYQVSGYITLTAAGSGATNYGISLSLVSSAGFITNPGRVSLRGHQTQDTWLSVAGLHYYAGGAGDLISLQVWHNQGTSRNITFRQMTATKVSNTLGGS